MGKIVVSCFTSYNIKSYKIIIKIDKNIEKHSWKRIYENI